MTNPRPTPKRLTETQMRAVLERALELQAAHMEGDHEASSDNSSLQQLSEAAAEIGVSPELVQKAAAEVLAQPTLALRDPITIRDGWLVIDQLLPGNLSPDDLPSLIDKLQRITGVPGHWQANTGQFVWRSESEMSVHISNVGRNARIEIRSPYFDNSIAFVGAATLAGTITAWMLISQAVGGLSADLTLVIVGCIAGALAATVHALTFRLFARARRFRFSEAKSALSTVIAHLRVSAD